MGKGAGQFGFSLPAAFKILNWIEGVTEFLNTFGTKTSLQKGVI